MDIYRLDGNTLKSNTYWYLLYKFAYLQRISERWCDFFIVLLISTEANTKLYNTKNKQNKIFFEKYT